jgi:hypothetical protein
MTNERNDPQITNHMKSQKSTLIIVPPMFAAPKNISEKKWRDILLLLTRCGVEAEILLIKSSTAMNVGRRRMTPVVFIAINKAGPDTLTPTQLSHALDSIFLNRTGAKDGSLASWKRISASVVAKDVIKDHIERLRDAHQTGQSPFNRANWYSMDAGIIKRASIDLSKNTGSIHFRAVPRKKETSAKKTPARSR